MRKREREGGREGGRREGGKEGERERESYLHLLTIRVGIRIAKALAGYLSMMGSITEEVKIRLLSEWVEGLVMNILRFPFLLLLLLLLTH